MKELILASRSPRRKELLASLLGSECFACIPAQNDEVFHPGDLNRALLDVAGAKAAEIHAQYPHATILSADTIVVDGDRILGKPRSLSEARQVLRSLSGRWHDVRTGMVLLDDQKSFETVVVTRVHFRSLSDEEIESYISLKTCLDKAGSYGIQDTDFADMLEGSYSNVVGLPLEVLKSWLAELNLLPE